jgi:hypothetical protein
MIGMLEEVLRRDAVADSAGIARELQILLEHLIGVAADPDVGTRAVEVVSLAGSTAAVAATVRTAMGLARAASATPSILVIRSHASITSHCCGPGFASQHLTALYSPCGEIRKRAQSSSGAGSPGDRYSDVGGRIRGSVSQRL